MEEDVVAGCFGGFAMESVGVGGLSRGDDGVRLRWGYGREGGGTKGGSYARMERE